MTAQAQLEALRTRMRAVGLTAYFVPSTDPHQSEYTPAFWQRRQWVSGFTGSVGDLVVTLDEAHLWTDSRYYLQAEEELSGSGVTLKRAGRPGVPSVPEWLAASLGERDVLGVDPRLCSLTGEVELRRAMSRSGGKLKLLSRNLVDDVWSSRPAAPACTIRLHPIRFAGESARSKLARLRSSMGRVGARAIVISRLDSIAWLLNLRGGDVDFTPVFIAYLLVEFDRALLFVDVEKVTPQVERALSGIAEVRPYEGLAAALRPLAKAGAAVWTDPSSTTAWVGKSLRGARLLRSPSPVPAMKARKNAAEVRGARAAHLRDGVAVARFLAWLERAVRTKTVTELGAADRLEALRSDGELYRGPSFRTISAYGSHGAIVHYGPSPESDRRLRPGGIYLVDSGGQYVDGTTDVTRTILLGGRATKSQKDHFTRVLRGHVALARCRFPAGTPGWRLDPIARTALWERGLDYGHGTGHGIGSYLGVHEGPPGIAPAARASAELLEGHILSNEPGFYLRGRYGIRTENLVLVVRDRAISSRERPFLRFETLTLCPIDRRLIELQLLAPEDRAWLDEYHECVREKLEPLLEGRARRWLVEATRPLGPSR